MAMVCPMDLSLHALGERPHALQQQFDICAKKNKNAIQK